MLYRKYPRSMEERESDCVWGKENHWEVMFVLGCCWRWIRGCHRERGEGYTASKVEDIRGQGLYLLKNVYWFLLVAHWLSLVVAIRSHCPLQCTGCSLRWLLLLRSMGSRHGGVSSCRACGLTSVPHRLSCCVTCGVFPSQGSNLCPLPWQADS